MRLINHLKMGGGWVETDKRNKELQKDRWLINEDKEEEAVRCLTGRCVVGGMENVWMAG